MSVDCTSQNSLKYFLGKWKFLVQHCQDLHVKKSCVTSCVVHVYTTSRLLIIDTLPFLFLFNFPLRPEDLYMLSNFFASELYF